MASMRELLGATKRQDLFRVAYNEALPYRGKKKHYSQMTQLEKDSIMKALKNVERWRVSSHALDRLVEKGINATKRDIISVVHNATILEYHQAKFDEKRDIRILLRANAVVNGDYNLNVVFSVTRAEIVSVWLNKLDDRHDTLDMEIYTKGLKIAL